MNSFARMFFPIVFGSFVAAIAQAPAPGTGAAPPKPRSPAAGGNPSGGEGDEYIVRLPMPAGARSPGLNAGPWRAPAPTANQTQSGTDNSPKKQVERIRGMLRGRKFRELTAEAEAVQSRFEADLHREAEVENWFEAFHTRFSPGLVDALFLEWERATPSSWAPMLARAYWKEDASVVKDLRRVVELNPKLLAAHSQLISIASYPCDPVVLSAYLTKAIEQCPGCYLVRRHYMLSIQPRTCGSWEQMDAFAQESLRYAKENPRLTVLEGFSYWDRGRTKREGRQPEEGLRLAMKSVEYGDDSAFYAARGNTYYALGRNAEALSDLNFAVELEPFNGYMYLWRLDAFAAMGNYPAASEDLKTAQALYYGRSMDEWAGQMRKWLASQVNR